MIAGREVLGFPKKLASNISLVVDGEEVSSNERLAKLDPEELRAVFPPGASIEASVTREGVELLRLTGRVASREGGGGGGGGGGGDEGSIHSNGRRRGAASSSSGAFGGGETVFLNVRTTHPLPPDSASAPDPACLGDRPKTVQFVFDEVPAEDATRGVDDARVVVGGSRVDPIAAPFADEPTRGDDGDGGGCGGGAGGSRGEDRGDEPVHGDGTRADARGDGAAGVPREGRGVLAQVSVNARGDRRKPASRERAVVSDLSPSLCASSARSATPRSAERGFLVEMQNGQVNLPHMLSGAHPPGRRARDGELRVLSICTEESPTPTRTASETRGIAETRS